MATRFLNSFKRKAGIVFLLANLLALGCFAQMSFLESDDHLIQSAYGTQLLPSYTTAPCVAGTVNRFTGSYHSNLYIGNANGTNVLLAWGQNMLTYTTASAGNITSPAFVNTSSYAGIPYEVRSSSTGGAAGPSVMAMRTSTKLYVFGNTTNISAITSMANFGGASLISANSDVTSKLPAGVVITDVAQIAVSQTAFAIVTNAGHVYVLTKQVEIQGDKAAAGTGIWHHVTLSDGSTFLSGVVKFSLSSSGAFALTASGSIYYWGSPANVNGVAVAGSAASYNYAYDMSAQIPSGTNVTDIVVLGMSNTTFTNNTSVLFLLCNNLKVYSCGLNEDGVLGVGNGTVTFNQPTFQQVSGLSNIVRIDGNTEAGLFTMGAMSSDGRIYGWGDGVASMLGIAAQSSFITSYTNATPVDIFGVAGFLDFSIAGHFTIAFFTNPTTAVDQYCYVGHNTGGSIGLPAIITPVINNGAISRLDAPPPISFNCSNTQPTIEVTETLTSFSACIGTASISQTFTVAGTSMSNNISITAPAGFEISTSSGSGYGSTVTLTHTGGTVALTIIYLRVAAGATGILSGNIVCSSIGATSIDKAISGAVNALPSIATVTGAARTGAGSLIISGTVTPTTGTTIDWYAAITGGTALSAGNLSYTTGVLASTTTYFAEARNSSTGCISSTRTAVVATVNGVFSAGNIGADQSLCLGATANTLNSITTASGGTGAITYQWQWSLDNSIFSDIVGATQITYAPISLSQTTYFKRLASTTTDGSIASNTITVTIQPLPIASIPLHNARTGSGPVIIGATASAGATLDWYATTTGGTILTGGNAVTTFTTPSISVTTTYYAEARNNTTGCVSTNRIAVIATINGSFAPGAIGANQSLCNGTTAAALTSITSASGGTGSISYQWEISTTSASSGFTTIAAAVAAGYSPGILAQTAYFRRVASTSFDGAIYSNVITITIQALPVVPTAINGSRTGAGVVSIGSIVNAGETTDWYAAATGGSILAGGTGINNYNTPVLSATTIYYALARNTSSGCISNVRIPVTATVMIPTPTISVTGSFSSFNSCAGSVSSEQTFTVSGTDLVSNLTIVAPTGYEISTVSGAGFNNSISLSPTAGTVASTNVYARLNNTALNTASGNILLTATNATSKSITTGMATVSNLTVGGTLSGAVAVCASVNNTTLNLTGNTGSVIKWQMASDAGFTSATDIANTTNSLTATNLLANSYYRAVVQNGFCAIANSTNALITVNPIPSLVLGAINSVTTTATSFSIPYTVTNADKFSLLTGATALAGFTNIIDQNLLGTPLSINIPASAANAYQFNISVKNASTGCISSSYPIVLNVIKANPVLTLADITESYGNPNFTIAAVSNSPAAISYTSSNPLVATIVGNQVTIIGAGSSIITANQVANANYNAASTTATMLVNKLNATLSLSNYTKIVGDPNFSINASSNSSGAISYSINNPSVATISGNTVTVIGAGTATITATQLADANYLAATATSLLIVGELIPSDLHYPSPNIFYIDASISPLIPTVVGTPTLYTVSPALPPGLSINPITGVISGTPTVYSATQNYTVTASITTGSAVAIVSITVNKLNTVLSIANITKSYGDPNFNLNASSNSTGLISYASGNAGVATIAGNTVTLLNAGVSTITVTQAEDSKHIAATSTAILTVNKIASTLVLADIAKNYGDPTFNLSATTNSSGMISYSISDPTIATVTGNQVTIAGAGTTTITVTQAADQNHFAATITAILYVNKIGAALALGDLIKTYGDANFSLSATTVSTGAISYTSSNAAIASINTNIVSIKSAGVVTITVTQMADANHHAATATATLTIHKLTTVLLLANIIKNYADPDFMVNATSNYGAAISYVIANTSIAINVGNLVSILAAGNTTITATQLEDANHTAGSVTAQLTVNKIAPILSLSDMTKFYGDPSFSLSAITTSNAAISYTCSNPSIATISGNQVNIVAAGVVTITVTQLADANHLAATTTAILTINKVAGTLILADIIKNFGDPSFAVNASSNSTGAISYQIVNSAIATIQGNNITLVSAGITTITVAQVADANHEAVTMQASLQVNKISPTISLADITKSYNDPTFKIAALSNSNGTISYTLNNASVATIAIDSVFIVGAGTATITVIQAASNNYLADTITATLYVNKINTSLSLSDITKTIGDLNFTVHASSNSTGAITYSSSIASVATIAGNLVTINGIGISIITVVQAEDANHLAGSTTAELTVLDKAPIGLSYPTPNVFTIQLSITALSPTVTGNVTGYSISPALPLGLSINATTGIITGTPTEYQPAIIYTVTATNTAGSVNATLSIAINKLSAIISLSAITKTIGDPAFTIAASSNSTGIMTYVSNTAAIATIVGNQVTLQSVGVTTITVTQLADAQHESATAIATLTVLDRVPMGLSYPSPNVFPIASAITALQPTVNGNVVSYSITPTLPLGLNMNAATGIISGTPTVYQPAIIYTVTATNTAGSVSTTLSIAVNKLPAIISLSNSTKTIGDPAFALNATSNSTGLLNYLSSNASIASVIGNQASIHAVGVTTITVTQLADDQHDAGIATALLTVVDIAPMGLSYPTPNVFTIQSAINALSPTVTGNVTGYSISPNLPAGLTFNNSTGVISGTPTVYQPATTYTVVAGNTAGSVSATLSIAVNKLPTQISLADMTKIFGDPVFALNATSNSAGFITYISTNPLVATIVGNQVTITGVGITTIIVSQAADAVHLAGNTTAILTVNAAAWVGMNYPSPHVYNVNTTITPIVPTIGGAATNFSITPMLPTGLTINASTGIINGTVTEAIPLTNFTITATINGNSYSALVKMTVHKIPAIISLADMTKTIGDPVFTLNAVSNSLGAITYSSSNPSIASIAVNQVTLTAVGITSITVTQLADAQHHAGMATAQLIVKERAPIGLSYTSPNVYTIGTMIAPLLPTVTGNITGFSISPALPNGLNMNSTSGIISGTPTLYQTATNYTVTATNSAGTVSASLSITVNKIPAVINLSDLTKVIGDPIFVLNAVSNSSGAISYSIANASVATINANQVTINGVGISTITVTQLPDATHGAGNATAQLTVKERAPMGLNYASPNVLTVLSNMVPLAPVVIGTVTGYSISPALPAGLSINANTGVISGTPTAYQTAVNYTVTATNAAGTISIVLSIAVKKMATDIRLSAMSKIIGDPVFAINATSNNTAAISYSCNNNSIATVNGNLVSVIGVGTAVITASQLSDATHEAGVTSAIITVNAAAWVGISYPSPNVYTVNTSINPLQPTIGGNASDFNVMPNLPRGLSINSSTGIISGTVLEGSDATNYTVSAVINGATYTAVLNITVNKLATTIQLANISKTIGDPVFGLNASSNSLGTILYGITNNAIATIVGNQVTLQSVGVTTITVTQLADAQHESATAIATLTVLDRVPMGLSYPSPNVFPIASAITALQPTVNGNVVSYSITPTLPLGLNMNAATGIISGTPTVYQPAISYTVTATNTAGSVSTTLSIAVNKLPAIISLSNSTKTIGDPVFTLNATTNSTGTISYTSSNAAVATISGNQVTITGIGINTIVVNQSSDAMYESATTTALLTVNAAELIGIQYPSPNVYTVTTPISALTPTVLGSISGYSISPILPNGLTLNAATGVISGTPAVVQLPTNYTVSAVGSTGNVSATLSIAVIKLPTIISMLDMTKTLGDPAFNLNATSNSAGPISYTSNNSAVATIVGNQVTITGVGVSSITVTQSPDAIHEGATTTALLTVTEQQLRGLSYASPNVLTIDAAMNPLTPTIIGTVSSYLISPALPTGLIINSSTGVISGTPTMYQPAINYTVTATNAVGAVSASLSIAVNKLATVLSLADMAKVMGDPNFTLNATSNSTGVINYQSSNPTVATIIGNIVSIHAVGQTTITANQLPDTKHNAATSTAVLTVIDRSINGLSYPSPNIYTIKTAITALTPTVVGVVNGYTISPALPNGLKIDPTTGIISGTPTAYQAARDYIVTATNSAGNIGAIVNIAVNKMVPTISLNNIRKTFGDPDFIVTATSNSTGKISYAINTASIATVNGNVISLHSGGIATITVTQEADAEYEAGTFKALLLVNPLPKNGMEYPMVNILTIDSVMVPIHPVIQGTLDGFSISPALPAGININKANGIISGTPTVLSKMINYIVTANDGNVQVMSNVGIEVIDIAPSKLVYVPNIDTANPRKPIIDAIPRNDGGKIVLYSINPSLPLGIKIDAKSGIISGKIATVRNGQQVYTITGSNTVGAASANFTLIFNSAPTAISLSSNTVFENQPMGTQVAQLNTTDVDYADTHQYQLVLGAGSADNASFEIKNNQLHAKAIFNFEQKSDYLIRIKTTDEGGLSYEQAFVIHVIDINEAPTLSAMTDIRVYNVLTMQVVPLRNLTNGSDLNQTFSVQVSANKSTLFEEMKVVGDQLLFTLKPNVFGNDVLIKMLVKDNGGVLNGGVDSIERTFVLGIDALPKVTASPALVTIGKTTQLLVEAAHAVEFKWNTSNMSMGNSIIKNPVVSPTQADQFDVTVKNKWGYMADGSVKIQVVPEIALQTNNILTPNGDGFNDRWKIKDIELYPDNEVYVYDKAGVLVYRKKGYRNEWDGKLNGVPLKDDAYLFIIQYNKPNMPASKGYLTIIH